MINMQQITRKNPKLYHYVLSERNPEKNKSQKYDILSQIVIDVTTRTRRHTHIERMTTERKSRPILWTGKENKEKYIKNQTSREKHSK